MKVFLFVVVLMVSLVLSSHNTDVLAESDEISEVFITAMQTSGSVDGKNYASYEFMQIYNSSDEDVDVTNWCLKYASSGSDGTGRTLACFLPNEEARLFLPAGSYALAVSSDLAEQTPEEDSGDLEFSAGLAAGGGHVILQNADEVEIDRLGWGSAEFSLGGASFSSPPAPSNQQVLERKTDEADEFINTRVNYDDFELVDAGKEYLFGSLYEQAAEKEDDEVDKEDEPEIEPDPEPEDTEVENEENSELDEENNNDSEINEGGELSQEGLIITELLPNPDGTDTGNEFIEIYNTNDYAVDLSEYKIFVGLDDEVYDFPADTQIDPLSYMVFYDSGIGFTLVNSQGQVKLQLDDYINETLAYEDAPSGQSWALINEEWVYTNRPTSETENLKFDDSLVVSNLKPCANNQYRHPDTNRCRLMETSGSSLTPCREDQYRHPETNRWRKIATNDGLKPCDDDQYRHPETNRCRSVLSAQNELKPCSEDQYRHPETNRCRKVVEMTDAPHVVEPIQEETGDTLGFWVLGGVGALAAGYALWEWRSTVARFFTRR